MAAPLGGAPPLEELVVETGAGETLVEAPLDELVEAPVSSSTDAIWEGKPIVTEEGDRCLALCAVTLMFSLAGIMENGAKRPWCP